MASPEHGPTGNETNSEKLPRDIERAPELLDKKAELASESKEELEKNVEKARNEADHEAVSGREISRGEHKQKDDDSTGPAFRSRKESYKHTMQRVQAELSAPERVFSKVIHNKAVERTSEALGSTVARPDAILSGSIFAFILVLGLYLMAKYYGFSLSGFETIAAFIIGWIVGIIFDLLRTLITGKRG